MNLLKIFRSNKKEDASKNEEALPTPDGKHNVQAPSTESTHKAPSAASSTGDALPESSPEASGSDAKPSEPVDIDALQPEIVKALKTVYDPEIPVDIYELGLIYEIKIEPDGNTYIKMTLTSPNCPVAGILPGQVESAARGVDGVYDVKLDLVFDPPWGPDRMSEAAKLELGML